jgi:prepilin peptidase CpaA
MEHPFFPDPVFAWIYFLVLATLTAIAAVVDLRQTRIPKGLTLTALGLGVAFSMARGAWLGASGQVQKVLWLPVENNAWLGALDGLLFALVGFLLGFGLFFVMWILGTCGGGDVKLFAALGTWGGGTLTVLLLAVTIGFVVLLSVIRLAWLALHQGAKPAARDFSMRGAARKGKKAGKQGYAESPTSRRRLMTYSLPVALSVIVVFLWVFRTELRLVPEKPAQMEITGGSPARLLARR